jgi:hypothetical protein
MFRTRLFGYASVALLSIVSACGDGRDPAEPDRPEPGELVVSVAGLPTSLSGVVLTLSGPVVPSDVAAFRAGDILHLRNSTAEARVAIFGYSLSGNLLRFKVLDTRKAASYQARILEATGEDNQLIDHGAAAASITR